MSNLIFVDKPPIKGTYPILRLQLTTSLKSP